jgi:hypothetical protein
VWGGFLVNGGNTLLWIDDIIDKDIYHKVLKNTNFFKIDFYILKRLQQFNNINFYFKLAGILV